MTIDYNVPASTVTVTPSGKDGTRTTTLWRDGRIKSVSGTGIPSMYIDYGVEAGGLWTKVWANTDTEPGNGNYPWTRTGFDFRGRLWKTSVSAENNSYIETESGYDDYGRPEKEITRAGNVVKPTVLIVYDSAGLPWRAGIDMNNNGTLDPNTTDRFVRTDATINNGSKLVVSSFYPGATGGPLAAPGGTDAHFTNPGAIAPVQISTRRERLTGFAPGVTSEVETTDINGKTTTETTEISNGHVIRRTTVPDSTLPIVEDYRDGRLLSRTDQFGHTTTYAYDGLGRLTGTTDARGNTTTTAYNSKGQVESETDATGHLTTYAYDPETGRVIRVTDPRNGTVNYDYDPHGNVTRTWGSATYPTETGYDTLNRRISLKTFRGGTAGDGINWPAEPGTPDTTSWTYDGSSGLLTRKSYPNGGSVNYSYDGFNRMTGRAWARGINTTYAYNELDQLTSVAYSDGTTPGIGYTYNGFGQRASVTDAAGTRAFSYNSKFQQIAESITGLYAKAIGRTYDDFGRVSGTTIAADSYSVGHGYDATGRLTSLTGNNDSWAFSYLANTNLLSQVTGPHGITVNGTYETQRDLLTRRENRIGGSVISAFNHTNDELGRRITAVRTGAAFTQAETLSFGYNSRSELTSAVSSLVQQNNWNHLFTYDNIGNRLTATKGQANPLTTTYQTGPANVYDKVKEGSQQEASLNYDEDGNMLGSNDGWAYLWDGENRLVRASRTVIDPVNHVQTVTVVGCVYDYMSRRVEKTVTINGVIAKKLRFVYDGYQLIQELNGLNNNALIRSYVWSGEKLAAVKDHASGNTYYYMHDTNKNVSELVSHDGVVLAHYEYDPFGALSKSTGAYAQANPFRFSNEYWDDDLGLVYYNYRYYSPKFGRWLSRDLIEEQGGLNLYGFIRNRSYNAIDVLGLEEYYSPEQVKRDFDSAEQEHLSGNGWRFYDNPNIQKYEGHHDEWSDTLHRLWELNALTPPREALKGLNDHAWPVPIIKIPVLPTDPLEEKKEKTELDYLKTSLDALGVADPSPLCDGTSAVISLLQGEYVDAGISCLSMIPYFGDLAKGGKYGGKLLQKADEVADASKIAIKRGSDVCESAPKNPVEFIKNAKGKGNNITVKTQKEAEEILNKARPEIPWRETYGPKEKIGAEVHSVDGSGIAPGHAVELPHIKWRDWSKGKKDGVEGHIYFESVNGEF